MVRILDLGSEGLCGAAFVGTSSLRLITGCQDGRICVREMDSLDDRGNEVQRVDSHPIQCIAAHPQKDQFAVGNKSGGVHVFQHPSGQSVLGARLQMPAFLLSYNGTGEKLAAAGDDECIHIINVKLNPETNTLKAQVLRKLKAVPHSRGLGFDPQGEFVAAVAASGLLQIWEMLNGKQVLSRKKAGPDIIGRVNARVGLAWHPEGLDLALAGPSSDIVMYERHNWQESGHLDGGHSAPVAVLAFSPNGLYLASAGLDDQLVIWDLHLKSKLASQELPGGPTSLEWKPEGNAVLCSTNVGKLFLWEGCVPKGNRGPIEAADSPVKRGFQVLSQSGVDEEAASDREGSGDQGFEGQPSGVSVGGEGGMSDGGLSDRHAKSSPSPMRPIRRHAVPSRQVRQRQLQPPFQPGAFPHGNSERRWLCYNMRGGVSLKEDGDMSILETSFHDTLADSRRIPPHRDYHNLEIAALGERGVLFARRGDGSEEPLLAWKPFASPYANSEWSLTLAKTERIDAIAAGKSFLAVATSQNHLRLFTTAGLQLSVLTLIGPTVTLAAKGDLLAVVWHGNSPPRPSDQSLEFAIYNANHRTLTAQGSLPISPGSSLTWLAFSEEDLLASLDSEGILRVRGVDFGGCWTPLFSSANHQQGGVTHWPVAVTKAELYCIVCGANALPTVQPRPILTRLPLAASVVGSDPVVSALEGSWIRTTNHLAHIRAQKEEAGDLDEVNELDAEENRDQTEADRFALKLFQDALKTGRLQRAQELAACLHLERSLQGALKLTNLHKIPLLAERISRMLESLEQERAFETPPTATPTAVPSYLAKSPAGPPSHQRPTSTPPTDKDFAEASEVVDIADEDSRDEQAEGRDAGEVRVLSRPTDSSSSLVTNPFARKGGGPLKEKTNLLKGGDFDDERGKRKAGENNPFMRQPKSKLRL